MVDDGILLEVDAVELAGRIPRRSTVGLEETPLSEQSLSAALSAAKYFKDQILKG